MSRIFFILLYFLLKLRQRMSFYCMLLGWLPLTAECVPILSQNRIPSTKYQWLCFRWLSARENQTWVYHGWYKLPVWYNISKQAFSQLRSLEAFLITFGWKVLNYYLSLTRSSMSLYVEVWKDPLVTFLPKSMTVCKRFVSHR